MKRADWWALGAMMLLALAVFAAQKMTRGEAARVELSVGGKEVASLPLDRDGAYRWQDGDAFVLVEVRGGAARVADASCPDKLCVKQGAICESGDAVVCLPNRFALRAVGGENELDAVIR